MTRVKDSNWPPVDIVIPNALLKKWERLINDLSAYSSVAIAYSGGIDSSFLAFVASRLLGENAIAITIISSLDPAGMKETAVDFAVKNKFQHVLIDHNLLADPRISANPVDRCYHCKKEILALLWKYVRENQISGLIEGQNADDLIEYRPGRKAVEETGTFSPLAANGFTKNDIRTLSKALGLSVWDQPASPCLATRIPYGMFISTEALHRIDQGEAFLRDKGFLNVRVRHFQEEARIEVDPSQISDLLRSWQEFKLFFNEIGFSKSTIDQHGYRSGSLNEGLDL